MIIKVIINHSFLLVSKFWVLYWFRADLATLMSHMDKNVISRTPVQAKAKGQTRS